MDRILGYFVLAAMTVLALALAGDLIFTSGKVVLARDWVAVPATVHGAELNTAYSRVGTRPGGGFSTYLDVDYSYEYEGRSYRSDKLEFGWAPGDTNSTRKHEQRRMAKADNVVAYVNPAKPNESVLDRSLNTRSTVVHLVILGFPGIFGLITLVGFSLWPLGLSKYQLPIVGMVYGALPLSFLWLHGAAFGPGQRLVLMVLGLLFLAGLGVALKHLLGWVSGRSR